MRPPTPIPSHRPHDDKEITSYHYRQGALRDGMARAMLRLERQPNKGPYLVATGVPPQVSDEWSSDDSAYHLLYDHDSHSVFTFQDPSPQHDAAVEQFKAAFQKGFIDLLKEPDAKIRIINPPLRKPRLVPCLVFECAYMNEDEATLVSEVLGWADRQFSVGLKIRNVAARLTFYTADKCGRVVTRYTLPHDAVDPRSAAVNPSTVSLDDMERVFKTDDTPLDSFENVPDPVGKLEKCYKMLGLSSKLSKDISIFERFRAQREEGQECESDDEGEDDALYGDNPPPSPLAPDDQLLVDVFLIRTHVSYAIEDSVLYTEQLRESVEAMGKGRV
ncbi:uncharacterized protein EV420DRAFT_1635328 [Desarmillaria tabescens]|uniref:Uncharacterized protein n=1 Tax=Armillaria tabescens TaxID=1929756 RepID=A0AA39NLZ3_ARMTA|nr:uncharacterized protein EV420DRAFT_1635328 [Desarmillaria tabescens]KAK0468066.1 hypothetical protein EV420DRAFT_1635328 [Desarmillaria tabescens]